MADALMNLPPVSIDTQIQCLERELGMRRTVYERRIRDRKMSRPAADEEIRRMEAALRTLCWVRDNHRDAAAAHLRDLESRKGVGQ